MTSPFGPMRLICNAHSGRGRVGRAMPEVRAHLDRRGLDYEIVFTQGRGHATLMTREALNSGCKFVVAMGGDGTIHEVVNGMIQDDRAYVPDAVMGIVSVGTGCDFIKTFGLPAQPGLAAVHLDGPEAFSIDIGKITFTEQGRTVVRYFANIAEAGLGADVVARAESLPRWLGPTVYLFAFWLTIARHRPATGAIDLVDRTYEGPVNNVVIANCQFFGGGMKIAPKAVPTDGLLDFQIEHASRREAIARIPKVFKGQHLPHPDVLEAKRVRASVAADRPLRIEADGELLGVTPATFEVLRDVLRLKV